MLELLSQLSAFEVTAAAIGFVAIYLQIKQISWYWPVSLVMVSMYIYIYYINKVYGDMSLQLYYVGVSIYGWYLWMKGSKSTKDGEEKKLEVSYTSIKEWMLISILSIVVYFVMVYILDVYTDSDIPFIDSFTTTLSFVATWMLAKKKLENWIVWIVVDFISIGLYYYREMYPTMILFASLTILAFVGYYQWKKTIPQNEAL